MQVKNRMKGNGLMRIETTKRVAVGIAVASAAATVLTACSSSSSGGGGTPTPDSSDHAVPTETFPNISPKANTLIQKTLPVMRGVATNTYQNGSLIVIYTRTATKADQTNVENTVHQAEVQTAPPAKGNKKGQNGSGGNGSTGNTSGGNSSTGSGSSGNNGSGATPRVSVAPVTNPSVNHPPKRLHTPKPTPTPTPTFTCTPSSATGFCAPPTPKG